MLEILTTTENQKLRSLEDSTIIAGKLAENTRAKMLFAILPESSVRVELSCSRQNSE